MGMPRSPERVLSQHGIRVLQQFGSDLCGLYVRRINTGLLYWRNAAFTGNSAE
ncbi:hypothetical protein [Actinomyces vulturis]|uniref:hypothetical protein n=1 Tax=Actinomyces vulturis TaxID=1857645 RepID=UPI00159EDDF9|nr:hypothetical protein [Actinomyces vulturis]